LGFKASSIDKKSITKSTPNSIQNALIRFKTTKSCFYPWSWNFRVKAHSASRHFHNSKAWGGNIGIEEHSSLSWPLSISSSCCLWVKVSNLLVLSIFLHFCRSYFNFLYC